MILPRAVRGVVFDMDGLLVDSEVVFRDAMMKAARSLGRDLPLKVFLSMVGAPWEQNRDLALDHFGEGFDADAWRAEYQRIAHAEIAAGVVLKQGVIEILDLLESRQLPRAVATSSSHAAVERQLGASGIVPRFQAIVARGDYARGKPAPDPFLMAAERLGVDPAACLALEDSHNGVRAAHAAGMMTVMVPDLLAPTAEIAGLCAAVAETLHEVRAWLGDSP